ncbi:MAG: hypothetical protein FRX49_04341 [Trebouxia sp. A1-2]|nr:MAG: hypothetical protein FRX49_04341 [Trebouxia sp. A1-2]
MESILNAVVAEASQQLQHNPVLPAPAVAPNELPQLVSHQVLIHHQGQQCPERFSQTSVDCQSVHTYWTYYTVQGNQKGVFATSDR